MLTILVFLFILIVLVLAHELGHFATAKLSGVKVEEFGIGFPPRLVAFKRGETVYSLNAVPLGGFTKMAGEEDPSHPRSLASQKRPTRILILCAGSLMNLILPFLLFTIALMVPHEVPFGEVVVTGVSPDSPAAQAGLAEGDVFLSINGRPINNTVDLSRNVALNLGQEVTFEIKKADGTTGTAKLVPRWQPPPEQGAMGVGISMPEVTWVRQSEPFWQAIPDGFTTSVETFVLYKNEILKWFIGASAPAVVGPVGIAQMTGEVIQGGLSPLLQFAAFLSLSLGIINLFPLPALDGGRIAFVVLEWLRRGKRIDPKKEGLVHLIGFILLIAVILLVTYNDIIRIASGGSPIP
ncbi:MAG: RIP metalloprotease RseP [Dehalococcoidia bacterium]|nr:MAG: RIP metalloprotease RseP [Dehalococcoidia bacterium]